MNPIVLSEPFAGFLRMRDTAEGPDAAIARAFLDAEIDVGDPDAHDFFDIREHEGRGRISYSTRDRLVRAQIDPENVARVFKHAGHRIHGRPGAVAQRVTGVEGGHALDVFSTAVSVHFAPEEKVQYARGDRITYWYNGTHHCNCHKGGHWGRPASSCMSSPSLGQHGTFRLYEERAELAVLLCRVCGLLRARCLVWTLHDGTRRHDRLYGAVADAEVLRGFLARDAIRPLRQGDVIPLHKTRTDKLPSLDTVTLYCTRCDTAHPRTSWDSYSARCPKGHMLVSIAAIVR